MWQKTRNMKIERVIIITKNSDIALLQITKQQVPRRGNKGQKKPTLERRLDWLY